jgi:hypothetical protein
MQLHVSVLLHFTSFDGCCRLQDVARGATPIHLPPFIYNPRQLQLPYSEYKSAFLTRQMPPFRIKYGSWRPAMGVSQHGKLPKMRKCTQTAAVLSVKNR